MIYKRIDNPLKLLQLSKLKKKNFHVKKSNLRRQQNKEKIVEIAKKIQKIRQKVKFNIIFEIKCTCFTSYLKNLKMN